MPTMSKTLEILDRLAARGLSQLEIQRRSGVAQYRISRWKAGRVPKAADDALRLKALDDSLGVVDAPGRAGETAPAEGGSL